MTVRTKPFLVPPFFEMAKVLKPAETEHFQLSSFEVDDGDVKRMKLRGVIHPGYGRYWRHFEAGTYMGLYGKDGKTSSWGTHDPIMSDTPYERETNYEFVQAANGDVLIAGLGIGMIVLPILYKPEVRSVTVIEKEREISELVFPQLDSVLPKLLAERDLHPNPVEYKAFTVVVGDAFTYEPPVDMQYDCIWFDIWPMITSDNWEGMKILTRRYRKWWNRKGKNPFMGSWERNEVRYHVAQDKKFESRW